MKHYIIKILILPVLIMSVIPMAIYGAENTTVDELIKQILNSNTTPTEAIDSAIKVISSNCLRSREGLIEGESAIKTRMVPYTIAHPEISDAKLGELYCLYGRLCGQQGADRYEEAVQLTDKAMDYANSAEDYSLKGHIYNRKAILEEKYGNTHDAFNYFNEAINNFRTGDKNCDVEITNCYNNQAMIYLRLSDLKGIKRIIDNLRAHTTTCSDEWRDYALFYLYTIENVYFGNLYEISSAGERNTIKDSLNMVSLASIHLAETSENPLLKRITNSTWNYYNRAAFFLNCYDVPPVDSVEYYIAKMTTKKRPDDNTFDFEVNLSASSLRAEMWLKLGNYEKAKNALTGLLDEMENMRGARNIILDKIEVFKNLRDLSEQTHHLEDALMYADSIQLLTNTRHDNELTTAIKDSETKYRTQETELALARSESRRANIMMWFLAATGILLIMIIIFVIYASEQRRRRLQKEVEFTRLRSDIGRQLTEQYVAGLENERRRMSSELHDGVCNDLLAIQMNMNNGASAERIARQIDTCRESVRRISHELMPPEFTYASIDEVVRYFIRKQADAYNGYTDVRYESSAEERNWTDVPDNVALEVYRIIQEAVGNALKHSGASLVEVNLKLSATRLTATITDNGKYAENGKRGAGLESMKRRARSINASVTVTHPDECGTAVSLTLNF